jgi:hypothetical protein
MSDSFCSLKITFIPSTAVIFLTDIFVCHEVFHHLGGVVIILFVLKAYIFFLRICDPIEQYQHRHCLSYLQCNILYTWAVWDTQYNSSLFVRSHSSVGSQHTVDPRQK